LNLLNDTHNIGLFNFKTFLVNTPKFVACSSVYSWIHLRRLMIGGDDLTDQ